MSEVSIPQSAPPVNRRRKVQQKYIPAGQGLMLLSEARFANTETLSWCPDCNEYRPLSMFYASKSNDAYCKIHSKARARVAQQSLPARARRSKSLWQNYGITHDQYDAMFAAQNGVCAACSLPETKIDSRTKELRYLSVDHDHTTGGKVRALLCAGCNAALGLLREDPARIRALADYAERIKA